MPVIMVAVAPRSLYGAGSWLERLPVTQDVVPESSGVSRLNTRSHLNEDYVLCLYSKMR